MIPWSGQPFLSFRESHIVWQLPQCLFPFDHKTACSSVRKSIYSNGLISISWTKCRLIRHVPIFFFSKIRNNICFVFFLPTIYPHVTFRKTFPTPGFCNLMSYIWVLDGLPSTVSKVDACVRCYKSSQLTSYVIPDSKVNGAIMGPIWGRQDPYGPQVAPMNFAIWDDLLLVGSTQFSLEAFNEDYFKKLKD